MRSPSLLLCLGLFGVTLAVAAPSSMFAEEPVSPEIQAAEDVGTAFVKAFNAHDAAALAALWKQDAVYTGGDPTVKYQGRAAIQEAYAKLFKADPKVEIASRAHAVAEAAAVGVTLSGILDEQHTDGSVTSSHYTVHLVPVSGKWLIASVQEEDLPVLVPPAAHLQELDWFIGTWEDNADKMQILTTVTPAAGGNFLMRNYQRMVDGKPAQSGSQTIGWDQEQQCFRTWLFDENGSFGEGYWTHEGDAVWSVKLALKFPDGRRGALTQIVRLVSPDKIEIQNVDQQIDGASLPNSPVATLVKKGQTVPAKK